MPDQQRYFLSQATRLHHDGLDDEHQLLFALAKAGCDAHGQPDPAAALVQFDLFFAAIEGHFKHEEEVMERMRYPQLRPHRQHHLRLLSRLQSLRNELAGHSREIACIWAESAAIVIDDMISADLHFKTFMHEQGLLTGHEGRFH